MKKSVIIVSLCLVLCFVLCCSKKSGIDMKIYSYTGKVTVNSKAVSGMNIPLKTGDTVETMENSGCYIIINEKNILRLNPGSKLKLNISADNNSLELDRGWLAAVTRRVFTSQGKFLVKTPTVTAAIRGTSFCLKVENEKSSYFCTCNGAIELKGGGVDKSESVEAAHHSARRFSLDKTGSVIEDYNPGLLYHDDKGVEELAKIIGEKVDWSKPDSH